jgi:hypothetical protein
VSAPDVVEIVTEPVPVLAPGEALVHAAGGGDVELIRHGDVVPGQLERGPELPVAVADRGHREDAALAATARHEADGELLASDLVPAAGDDEGALVEETLLLAMQDAAKQAKEQYDAEMQKITSAFKVPGF